eukprot:gnl/Hemi2/16112_TR5345_c0_g1_i1.p1 gnl/Hemi2/16112_TR5345_c0_g1~~gnl/Hemi2/16112_TR5345_c0_g1_i1.p1  ORF type:complete len:324 (-),score=21.44 gnl/Hemi2/16112_TR5345_c0_g1_i1:100-1032(-)
MEALRGLSQHRMALLVVLIPVFMLLLLAPSWSLFSGSWSRPVYRDSSRLPSPLRSQLPLTPAVATKGTSTSTARTDVGTKLPPPVECVDQDTDPSALIWPLPRCYTRSKSASPLYLAADFYVVTNTAALLNEPVAHFMEMTFDHAHAPPADGGALLKRLVVVLPFGVNNTLDMSSSEEYRMEVTAGDSHIWAESVVGAIRGLETFSQLVTFDFDVKSFLVSEAPWVIHDYPRFVHRGLLVDSSRHFMPKRVLKRILDTMSMVKLNVMHWHIIDSHSFPLEVKSYPKLWQGTWSPSERYTQRKNGSQTISS